MSSPIQTRVAVYPVALAAALVIYVMDESGVGPFAVAHSLLAAVGLAIVMVVISTWLLGDRHRGGVVALLGLIAIAAGDVRAVVLAVIAVGLLLIERYVIPPARRSVDWSRIGRLASRISIVLILAVAIQAFQLGSYGVIWRAATTETALRPSPQPVAHPSDPDIYLILLDGHVRPDTAHQTVGVDPTPLREGLGHRGFAIAERSRANYPYTSESLSSMLDQAHLTDIPRMAGLLRGDGSVPAGAVVQGVINDNTTLRFLRDRGYAIEAIAPGFEQVALREADRFVDTGQMNEFDLAMLTRSTIQDLFRPQLNAFASGQHRDRIVDVLDVLATAPTRATDRPTFVFAHVPAPHAPWVFNGDGSPRTADVGTSYVETPELTDMSEADLRSEYAGAVNDIDRRLMPTLDALEAAIVARGRPAVTVVFSEHGSWIGTRDLGDYVRLRNLLAVRGDGVSVSIEPDLTLVNLMPSLFQQLFGQPWVRRADIGFIPGPRDIYDLHPVTDPGL